MTVTEETKKKATDIALIVLCVMALVGVALTAYFLSAAKNVIKVGIEPDKTQTVEFEHLGLHPGESCEYIISLSSEYSEEYRLELKFKDRAPELTLKDYACVRIERDGEILCDEVLATAFELDCITLGVDFSHGARNEIKIIFYMPEEIGNEAQDAEADFELLITATDE